MALALVSSTIGAQAATEFVCSIRETPGSGDYTNLGAWNAALKCDLTAPTNVTATYANLVGAVLSDGQKLVSWSGAATGSGTMRHMSTAAKSGVDAFLLAVATGDVFVHGQTLSCGATNFVVTSPPDTAIAVAQIEGVWINPETATVAIGGWVTDTDRNYIRICTRGAARHNGLWTPTAYRIETPGTTPMTIAQVGTRVDGLQFWHNGPGSNTRGVSMGNWTPAWASTGAVWLANSIVRGIPLAQTNSNFRGIDCQSASVTSIAVNCVIYDIRNSTASALGYWCTRQINCLAYNCDQGFRATAGGSAVGCIAFNCGQDFNQAYPTNCASDDGTGTAAVKWSHNTAYWSSVFRDYTNHDFRLNWYTGSSNVIGKGVTAPAYPDSFNPVYLNDIAGNARAAPWDIGPFAALTGVLLATNAATVAERDGDWTLMCTVLLARAEIARVDSVAYATGGGNAVPGVDYESATGTLTFNPGQISTTVAVTIHGNTTYQGDRWFTLALTNPANCQLAAPAQQTIAIAEDDGAGVPPALGGLTAQVTGNAAWLCTALTNGSGVAATFYWGRDDGLTVPGNWEANATVAGPYNSPAAFSNLAVNLMPNTAYYFACSATNAQGGVWAQPSGVFTSGYPGVQFAAASGIGAEGTANVTVNLSLSGPVPTNVTVDVAVAGGTAVNGVDYAATPATVAFSAGATNATYSFTVIDNALAEPTKTLILGLSNPVAALLGLTSNYTYFIANDDAGVNYVWDGDGDAVSNGWSYQSGGAYVNWQADPVRPPGQFDYVSIAAAGRTAAADFSVALDGGASKVSARGEGATLIVPPGVALRIGEATAQVLTVGGGGNLESGAVIVDGGALVCGNAGGYTYVGNGNAGNQTACVGRIAVRNDGFLALKSSTYFGSGSSAAGSPCVGVLNVHTGSVAINAVATFGSASRAAGSVLTNVGIVDLRQGMISSTGTMNFGASDGSGAGIALIRGFGSWTANNTRFYSGAVTAQGDGQNRDLNLSGWALFQFIGTNLPSGTYGFYATDKGRLLMPLASNATAATRSYVLGMVPGSTNADFVNSVLWTGCVQSANTTVQGAILAPDRMGLVLPVNIHDVASVWSFTVNKAVTNAWMVFRYDHARAAAESIPEGSLRLTMDSGGGWVDLEATVDKGSRQLRVRGVALPAGETRFAAATLTRRRGVSLIVR